VMAVASGMERRAVERMQGFIGVKAEKLKG
jgi:hypothetical protein